MKRQDMAEEVLNLRDLAKNEVPEELKASTYFDFKTHPFKHQDLFDQTNSVCQAIRKIGEYTKSWLEKTIKQGRADQRNVKIITPDNIGPYVHVRGSFEAVVCENAVFEPRSVVGRKDGKAGLIFLESGVQLIGCDLYVDKDHIFVGAGTTIEAGAGVKGPTIIGKNCEIRQGAYLRGDCILGDGCTIRGEMKNTVLMDKANFPHPSYLGDSICGYMAHFGNQATTANLGIYEGLRDNDKRHNLKIRVGGKVYGTGSPKMGVCMGDYCQVGCNCATDPGTFLRPYTIAYTLTRITKGFYGPNEVLKNKPMEHGVVERVPLRTL